MRCRSPHVADPHVFTTLVPCHSRGYLCPAAISALPPSILFHPLPPLRYDIDAALLWLGRMADLTFVFFDPIGMALCKHTLDVVGKAALSRCHLASTPLCVHATLISLRTV